jgi:hypothetical protein
MSSDNMVCNGTLQTLLPLLAVLVVVAIVYENGLGMPANWDGCIAALPIGAAVTTSAW